MTTSTPSINDLSRLLEASEAERGKLATKLALAKNALEKIEGNYDDNWGFVTNVLEELRNQ